MAIQVRRGLKADFDPTKMLPGEWAVSVDLDSDKQIIWMCFAAGIVKRMGTYEDFKKQIEEATEEIKEEYIAEFQTILDQINTLAGQTADNKDIVVQIKNDITNTYLPQMLEYLESAQTSETNAQTHASNASMSEQNADIHSKTSKSYAVGGTGTREGEDTDNAKYYYQRTRDIANVDIATEESAGIVKASNDISVASDGKMCVKTDFTEQSELAELSGTEDRKTFFGKIAKVVSNYIDHISTHASQTMLGHVKVTDSSAVTDSEGLALAATEKNAAISGTLGNEISSIKNSLTVTRGKITNDGYASWFKYGRIVIIWILNVVPSTNPFVFKAPAPLDVAYNTFASVDLTTHSIFGVSLDGTLSVAVGDATKQYTGEIIYLSHE